MRRRVNSIDSLRMAKLELKNDIELRKAKVEMEFELLKEHYLPGDTVNNIKKSDSLLSVVPIILKPLLGNFLIHKLLKSKGKFTSTIARLLISTFLK